jgi:hypothetical protein
LTEIETGGTVLDYAETLRLLDSWYGRRVVVSVQPEGSRWYVMHVSGALPRRSDIGLEWLADELPDPSEGYEFRFTDERLPIGFQLSRIDFRDATLDGNGGLNIRVAGAELHITPAKKL